MQGEEKPETGYKLLGRLNFKSIQQKGGFRASGFVFGLVALENMGFISNVLIMFSYFMADLSFNIPGAANTVTNFMGSTFILSIIGAFISDTFISRFQTCLIFGVVEIVAFMMMTIQAHDRGLHPEPCGGKSSCMKGGIGVMFYTSLALLALGSGGVRGALAAFGADQFDTKKPKELKAQASYFNWLVLSTTLGAAIGVVGFVWVSTNHGWWWGFFLATLGSFLGFTLFFLGKPFYRIHVPKDSPLLSIVQVIVAAVNHRKLKLPENPEELHESSTNNGLREQKLTRTSQFTWLDKAAIVPNDSKPSELSQWEICTVTQVEEVKILIRMLPIILSTVIMNTCLAQLQTFSQAQGATMNKKLGKLNFPAGSVPVIPLVFMTVLLPVYEFFFVPFARKFTKHPQGITQLQRVGVGLVLSAISMGVAGIVEVKRRNQSRINPFEPISLFWLSFQYGIFGIADMFSLVGLLEFFYKEAPVGMRSLATSFTWISMSLGYFLSSVLVDIVNSVTKRVSPSQKGWINGIMLDNNNLNLFYWLLAVLSLINFAIYLLSASLYKYKKEDDGLLKTEMASTTTSLAMISASEDELPKSTTQEDVAKDDTTAEPKVDVKDEKEHEAHSTNIKADS
ncbi:protein NRT1/ PTR FAMILY 4.5-like [Cynara cardunculus var. scolymus]|uniref:protein NRT1/ PTR FAMILY 4.5-like n=1 Tax=Cynara cardunculus var. scolymus TaxID=59895 RepID=UPI000D62966F|nr:protein NRT1/ PTR FAMILY 4.5-like [Cynara cardunculus var. scolymus]